MVLLRAEIGTADFFGSKPFGNFYNALDDVSRHMLIDKLLCLLMVVDEPIALKLAPFRNILPISYSLLRTCWIVILLLR